MARRRMIVVPGNAVNYLTLINDNLVSNFKRSTTPEIDVPPLFDRAYMFHYEDVVLPMIQTLPDESV